MQDALPQRPQRAPRVAKRSAAAPPSYSENSSAEAADLAAASTIPGPGRGRGAGARGGRNGEFSGRGRNDRSFSPDAGHRERGPEPDFESGGRGRGISGRGRRREDGGQAGSALGRGDSGRGAGRGYSRGTDISGSGRAPEAIRASELANGNVGTHEGGRGRGRGAGRFTADDYQDRGSGTGRGQLSTQRTQQAGQQQYRRQERSIDEEFPPLPGSSTTRKAAAAPSTIADMPPGVGGNTVAMDSAPTVTQGVRRYSKMAGKVGGGGSGASDPSAGTGGGAVVAPENGHARGAGTDGGGAAPRASKLSAAAATFEPSPATAAAATGRQLVGAQQPAAMPQQPVPSVPAAFGAPLQPMTVVATPGLPGGVVSEQYSVGMPPQHGQPIPYMQSQQQQPHAQVQQVPGAYGAPLQQPVAMPPQGIVGGGGSPMAPPPQNIPYTSTGTIMYGASPAEVEAWYQDAYQKALAIGMDPQQAYSAVQGYVQGLKMAAAVVEQQRWQQQQQMGGYAGVSPPQQMPPPPAGPASYDAAKPVMQGQ
ncbi:hypothetical protein Vretimale_11351 [Volvox reticuliferus]|nr:hypothetical protein Vretifemale_12128 [Volvox reticuliferus]GIM07128.1 hypothetical protein Vretimale_11351 [Volvox reticuliferus]